MNIYTLKDYYYELERISSFSSDFYSKAKKIFTLLHIPSFTLRDCQRYIPNLTYRKVNDWNRKNAITGFRKNKKAGWRKFSAIDFVKLFVISDLRNFGMNIENIKAILANISVAFVEESLKSTKKRRFLQLEYFIACSLLKEPILLLIDEHQNISFFQKREAIKYHFKFDGSGDPIIILPFFRYIQKIMKTPKKHE